MPLVTRPAPYFAGKALKDGKFVDIAIHDFRGRWVLLFFYPKDFTFVCPTEIRKLNDAFEIFKSLNVEIVAISTDSEDVHRSWTMAPKSVRGLENENLKLTLLSDVTHAISKAYDVLLPDEGISLRGSFMIDPKGILRACHIYDNDVGRSIDETVRVIQALQEAQATGDVVPADWVPGKETICKAKADAFLSKQPSKETKPSKRSSDDIKDGNEGKEKKKKKVETRAEKEERARLHAREMRLPKFDKTLKD